VSVLLLFGPGAVAPGAVNLCVATLARAAAAALTLAGTGRSNQ
jgi:hypothetical protein